METNNTRLGTIRFEDSPIRVVYNAYESVEWLCLNDIAKVLSRTEMIENGVAMKICKTAIRIPFKEGGRNRWGVKPHDVHTLLRVVSSDNGMVAKICRQLESWINTLPVHVNRSVHTAVPIQSSEPVIFNYRDQFPITFKANNGKTYVNATQMAKSFHKNPYAWLSSVATTEFRQMLVNNGRCESLEEQVITSGRGPGGGTWIEESLAMEFARWLSPEFSAWCNSRIEELVSNGYVSLEPVASSESVAVKREYRRTLSEAVGNFPVPQNFDEALLLAAEQARKIREDEHKVAFYEEYVENRDYYRSIRIADELEISIVALNKFLAEEGIIYFQNRQWIVRAPFRPLQCEVPYLWEKQPGKLYPTGSVKRWTKAGREHIIELWYEKHPELLTKHRF